MTKDKCEIKVCIDPRTGRPVASVDGDCPAGSLEHLIACVATEGIDFSGAIRDKDKKKSE